MQKAERIEERTESCPTPTSMLKRGEKIVSQILSFPTN